LESGNGERERGEQAWQRAQSIAVIVRREGERVLEE
jgi:hypothetical protein